VGPGGHYHNTFNELTVIVTLTFQALQPGSTSLGLWKREPNSARAWLLDYRGIKIADEYAKPMASIDYNSFFEVRDSISSEDTRQVFFNMLSTARRLEQKNGESP